MSLEVVKPGLLSIIQDSGRVGFQDKGIPKSGFMDVDSAHLANLLVNNSPKSALIEMCLVGAKFKVLENVTIAITGANMQAKVDGIPLMLNKAIQVKKDTVVSFSVAINGVYTYLAIGGVIKANTIFNSKSTYLPAKIGGIKGRPLKKRDLISVKTNNNTLVKSKVKHTAFKKEVVLSCLKGPEWKLFSEASKNIFFSTEYTIDKNSNRIGIRLNGVLIPLPNRNEIISSGIVKGVVQITKSGQPIVMMADAPTTGGYLRFVNLTEKACNQLAQMSIGNRVKFKML